ncbi:PKD domain-containing protein [Aquimarina intermedia]|uniref:PKD domain-containing protein n=1 Tax=Aquimarina intermedia TaxID=350814 RepID=A0A5S5C9R0_9FLAO|nr:PKD domain-containing protein [Aquimarina intermedia]TYP76141.1 PKD domain-containing protein [Aquimarina intermedia]
MIKVHENKLEKTIEYPYSLNDALSNNMLAIGFRAQQHEFRYHIFSGCVPDVTIRTYDFQQETIFHRSEFFHKTKEEQANYHNGREIKSTTIYDYKPLLDYPSEIKSIDSLGGTKFQHLVYPTDENNTILINANILAKPGLIENYTDQNKNLSIDASEKTFSHRTKYKVLNNGIVMPEIIKSAKGTDLLENRLIYHKYDSLGNPLEFSKANSPHSIFIWGYKNTLPIAKIDNASYDTMPLSVLNRIDSIKNISNTENSKTTEETLRNLLQELREDPYFSSSQVVSSTYDPHIGVTSMTDSNGTIHYYEYDDFNRLRYVLDEYRQVLKKINYNYQGETTSTFNLSIHVNSPEGITPGKGISFSAVTSSTVTSSNLVYTWYVNDLQESCGTNATFNKTFQTEGTYTVKVSIYDKEANKSVTKKQLVDVKYPPLTQPTLAVNSNNVLNGSSVPFTLSGVVGGSGDFRYDWYRNGTKQTDQGTYNYTNTTQGTHAVFVKIIDKITGKFVQSNTVVVYSYAPLTAPIVTVFKRHIVKGATVSFTTSGISGGSGSRSYEWYINNVKQSASGTTFSYKFSTTGTYTVRFKVIDLKITSHSVLDNGTAKVYVYNPMYVSASPVSGNINETVRSITFMLSTTGGSGTIAPVQWTIRQISPTSNVTTSNSTGTSFTFSTNTNGEYEITATIRDDKTGQSVLKAMPVIVNIPQGGDDPATPW